MRAFLLSVALLFVAPSVRADDAVLIEAVAARVGDNEIFVSSVRARMHGTFANAAAAKQAMHKALESIIDAMLIAKRAQELHVDVTSDEIKRARDAMANRSGLNDAELVAAIRKEGMTDAAYDAILGEQILEGKVLRLDIGNDARPSNPDELEAWVTKRRDALLQRLRADALVEVRL
ncbi:MAG TPA: SurA N-terminal domain-containing protein [Polyangiaceae bacterium]|jgi:parvulin-like peptidyl-prolyl isomerase|nr:SurA N-terminal domain-containing protein [Polyangiaceae bacterium]